MSRQGKLDRSQFDKKLPDAPPHDDRLPIDLRLNLDEVAAVEGELLRANARREPSRQELHKIACKIFDARQTRNRLMGNHLFGEPGWDMLLALYCLPKRGELVSVNALTFAASVPPTTGHRWQKVLMGEGLIERGPDGFDLRRQIVRLTPAGRAMLERYLTRLYYCDAPARPTT